MRYEPTTTGLTENQLTQIACINRVLEILDKPDDGSAPFEFRMNAYGWAMKTIEPYLTQGSARLVAGE